MMLFYNHLDFARLCWDGILRKGDVAIDATCGRGRDTLFLAQKALTPHSGAVYACDLQMQAVESTQKLLEEHLEPALQARVIVKNTCHARMLQEIHSGSVRLIVYNLGYLPGADKTLTTCAETTMESIETALNLLQKEGALSITCYPGHAEGEKETQLLRQWLQTLNARCWRVSYHRWIWKNTAPCLFFVQKTGVSRLVKPQSLPHVFHNIEATTND